MKFLTIFACLLLKLSLVELLLYDKSGMFWKGPQVTRKSSRSVTDQWIEQQLDNYNSQNNETYLMVYYTTNIE